ncbi:hypothetical protein ACO3VM_00605 [Methanocaldococcus sp. 10A]
MRIEKKVLKDLEIINNNAKYIGIKVIMIRHILESHANNRRVISNVLNATRNTELYDLILLACPKLKESEKLLLNNNKDIHLKS